MSPAVQLHKKLSLLLFQVAYAEVANSAYSPKLGVTSRCGMMALYDYLKSGYNQVPDRLFSQVIIDRTRGNDLMKCLVNFYITW